MSTITRAAITGSSVKDGFVLETLVLDDELQVDLTMTMVVVVVVLQWWWWWCCSSCTKDGETYH